MDNNMVAAVLTAAWVGAAWIGLYLALRVALKK